MKIAYYMPFKPLGHQNPSGDLIIGTELFEFLKQRGDEIYLVSRFRCRWVYLKPYLWPFLLIEIARILLHCRRSRPDLWLTYHSYYKAPDVIGMVCSAMLGIPYVIFQGVYSTKRKRSLMTVAGFYLNRFALQRCATVFTNKKGDKKNLMRLLPEEKVHYIAPGLHPEDFQFDAAERKELRQRLGVDGKIVVMCAAMFRPGVKTEGVSQIIRVCGKLVKKGRNLFLLIAGDGASRSQLELLARKELAGDVLFVGRLERKALCRYYSAADIFAFPGIEESLGMVYLEAQACGLPVVAHGNWGAKEAVVNYTTGLLSSAEEADGLLDNLETLVVDTDLRRKMGAEAAEHVRAIHDLECNYQHMHTVLRRLVKTPDGPL